MVQHRLSAVCRRRRGRVEEGSERGRPPGEPQLLLALPLAD